MRSGAKDVVQAPANKAAHDYDCHETLYERESERTLGGHGGTLEKEKPS